jgi:excisionase family DNA binding protein
MSTTTRSIRLYTVLETATICGVANQIVINWIRNGYLKSFTTPGGQYRVYEEDLITFLSDRGMLNPMNALHPETTTARIVNHERSGNRLTAWLEGV